MRIDIEAQETGYIGHSELIYFMQALGYKSCDAGICYGFACTALQALLLHERSKFNSRLKWMNYIYNAAYKVYEMAESSGGLDPDKQFDLHLKLLLEQISQGKILVPDYDKAIVAEIPAFCESIEMHFQPELFPDWFAPGKAPLSQSVRTTLPLMLPDKLRTGYPDGDKLYSHYQSHVVGSGVFTGVYSVEEIEACLTIFHGIIKKTQANVVLLLCSVSHAMAIGYDFYKQRWLHADVCNMPIKEKSSPNDIATTINWYFTDAGKSAIFSTQLFGLDKKLVEEIYLEWRDHSRMQTIHAITRDKTILTDWNQATWLHVAAQNNDIETVDKLLEVWAIPYTDKQTYDGKTPMLFAAEEGHGAVVAKLLGGGADPHIGDEAALYVAIKRKHVEMTRALLAGGASVNRISTSDHLSPLGMAIQAEDPDMIKLLLDHGAEINNYNEAPVPLMQAIKTDNMAVVRALMSYAPSVTVEHLDLRHHKIGTIHTLLKKFYFLQKQLNYRNNERHYTEACFKAICKIHSIALDNNIRVIKRAIKNFKTIERLEKLIEAFEPSSVRQEKAMQAFLPIFNAAYNRFCAFPFDDGWLSMLQNQVDTFIHARTSKIEHTLFAKRKHGYDDANENETTNTKKYKHDS